MEQSLSKLEIKALLNTINSNRDYAIATVLLTTGITLSELSSLTTDDIDLEKEFLTVSGNKSRTIPLNPQTKDAIARWLNERPSAKTSALFLTTKGTLKELSDRSIDHLLRKSGQEAGIDIPVTSILLRTTYAVGLFQEGAAIKQASELLGISDYNTLHKYQKMAEFGHSQTKTQESPAAKLETRSIIKRTLRDIFPVKPKPVKKLSSLNVELRPDPTETIFGRDHIIKEIRAHLNKGQSVLLTGKFGVGKTHILKNIKALYGSNALFFDTPAPVKTILFELCEKLGTEKFKSTTQIAELLEYALRNKTVNAPIIVIDNLDKVRATDLDTMIRITEEFSVLSATEETTVKLKSLWHKYKELEVHPLTPDNSKKLIKYLTQNMSISDYELMETRFLNYSNGLPLAIVDMSVQLSYANVVTREVVRDMHHDIGVVYRDWSYAVILLWAVLVLFRFVALGTHSFEGYILAGIGMSMLVVIKFFIFKGSK